MITRQGLNSGIPIATSLQPTLEAENITSKLPGNKKRIVFISAIAVLIAMVVSFIAKLLIYLINFVTNLSFYGNFSTAEASPQHNQLGLWVIVIPVIGGVIIGLMALYGSKAIRGHGIPEAMEQILVNDSKIKPVITYLKPISSAVSIGTGGPFGAEGPIIATGGALGSTLGQLLKITHHERKILLAAGATAGMSAIFNTPVAAIFLAIELLLFEFSAASIIPVALACITGSAGHHLFFEPGYVFPVGIHITAPSNEGLFMYSLLGILMGLFAVVVTKIVYYLEDLFERLPIHWMWWPAIGGVVVGLVGYFNPRTLGVGYNNITDVLSGTLPIAVILSLVVLKFISWAIALSSGTSGGTLAPLLTIGGAAGALAGFWMQQLVPGAGISIPLAALVGMAAMFAGASRALLTSIIFALESTGEANALLPLLASCTIAYFVSLFLMENTIMTEKIARRGIKTPESYKPDLLEHIPVKQAMIEESFVISEDNSIGEVRQWLKERTGFITNYYIITSGEGIFSGIISSSNLFSEQHTISNTVGSLIKRKNIWIDMNSSLVKAINIMVDNNVDLLPVVNKENVVIGTISHKDILNTYSASKTKQAHPNSDISIKRQTLKLLVKGRQLVTIFRK